MRQRLASFHEDPSLISLASSPRGQLLVWLLATTLLVILDASLVMPAALAAVMAAPKKRRLFLSVAALGAVIETVAEGRGFNAGSIALIALVTFALLAAIAACRLLQKLPTFIRRHSVLALHGLTWSGLILAAAFPVLGYRGQLLSWLLWRLSYLAQYVSHPATPAIRLRDHLFYLWPVFGGTSTPYGKGFTFLSSHEARGPAELAHSQLAGLKLLVLAIAWGWLGRIMDSLIFGTDPSGLSAFQPVAFDLTELSQAVQSTSGLGRAEAWLSIYLGLIRTTLRLAASGHLIIGCLRLLGFNVFRNTYKPLLSESILEFWNRYYYYFKELLVEFFFYPTFLATNWAPVRLRLFLAVFAAACVGNMYYHILTQPTLILDGNWDVFWQAWNSRLCYCLLLATGIWLSMLRQRKERALARRASFLIRGRKIAGVWTFYSLIQIFNVKAPDASFTTRLELFLYLFGA